jgi:hypothetical protein
MYQTDFGGFASFVPVVSAGARVASVTPALMPVMFYAISAISDLASTVTNTGKAPATAALRNSVYIRRENLGELPITVLEKLGYVGIDATDQEGIYLAYLGDTAVLAPSREALLGVLKTDKPTITSNKAYPRIKAEAGEIIFFSQLDTLLNNLLGEVGKQFTETKEKYDSVVIEAFTKAFGAETGAVRLSQSDWDAVFHLALGENDLVNTRCCTPRR